jgi:error-prone DNA polymerase
MILSKWREAGRWWDGEPEREFIRYLDDRGVIREECREYPQPESTRVVSDQKARYAPHTVDYDVMRLEERKQRQAVAMQMGQRAGSSVPFAPLHCLSALSFGRSAVFPEHIPSLATLHGMPAVALTDRFSLAGVVEFCKTAKALGVKPILGATIEVGVGGELVMLAKSADGYKNLSRLITRCHLSQPRLFPLWIPEEHDGSLDGIVCLTGGHAGPVNRMLIHKQPREAERLLQQLESLFGKTNLFVEIERTLQPWEISVNSSLIELASRLNIKTIAGGAITHATKADFIAQDALVCVETLCTVEEIIGRKLQRAQGQPPIQPWPVRSLNGERYFRGMAAWEELYHDAPEMLMETVNLASEFPDNPLPDPPSFPKFCEQPEGKLREVVIKNARDKYRSVTVEAKQRINGELERICHSGYASHFLAIWEACEWARSNGIHFSARGSAVDSVVTYCLGISRIDAIKHNLHFDRFLPDDNSKKPDIDVDFEAHRRDDVRHFLSNRYGADHVATVCAIATYQGRGIVRFVGKALMIPEETLGYLARRMHGSVSGKRIESGIDSRPELRDSNIPAERFRLLFKLAETIDGLPRHMGAHSSGVVISDRPLCETVPVMESGREGVRIIQWDKYSAKRFFNKFDILCLRGQDVMAGTQQQVRASVDPRFDVGNLPLDDAGVFEDFRKGNLIGTPQSASPAMRQAHIRLRSKDLHDVSLVQAGIRPGVGGAVKINELIRRRRGVVQYEYPHPLFEAILGLSYGIIVFQEQVDQLLQAFCGYTSGEAEEIRENIHKRRAESWEECVMNEIIERCVSRGFSKEIASHVFDLVSGFKGYGFAQGHALAFADISIRCVYCQQHYPAEYFASLLSNQPAGYYGPGTIANEARIRGVEILPIDINRSEELFNVENGGIRIGLIQQHGLSGKCRARLVSERNNGMYRSVFDFCARVRPEADELENLILSGALDSIHSNRRALLWAIPQAIGHAPGGALLESPEPHIMEVEDFTRYEKAVLERSMLGLDIHSHIMAFERERVAQRGAITCKQAQEELQNRQCAIVVGLAMRLRFPPTSSGRRIVFFDLEDETGLLNVTCFDETYQRDGQAIICSPFVTLVGEAQERDGHMAFLAKRVFPYRPLIDKAGFAEERRAIHAEDFIHRGGR